MGAFDSRIKVRYHGYCGVKHNRVTDRESGVYYAVFDSSLTIHEIRQAWESQGYGIHGYECSHEHDCCGCYFQRDMWIMRQGRRAIAYQGFGINI
jgi:hypothetical protein